MITDQPAPTSSPSQVMQAYWGRVSRGEVDGIGVFFAPDAVFEDVALGHARAGRDNIAEILTSFFAVMPCRFEIESLIDDGVNFAAQWTVSGLHTAALLGFPAPTGKPFRYRGVSVGVVRDGLIQKKSDYWNFSTLLAQVADETGTQ